MDRGVTLARPEWLPARADWPGLILSTALAITALAVCARWPESPIASPISLAILLGALIVNTPARRILRLAGASSASEPDRYAAGLRFVSTWLLRATIVLMGFKVSAADDLPRASALLIAAVALVTMAGSFFVAHVVGALLGVRRPLIDLMACGTMICGASAVNAITPVVGARREEQAIAVTGVFLFSVVALAVFQPIALLVGLDSAHAGLWSGLAVNDLSSAVAVGNSMGNFGGVMALMAKSARVLLLGPAVVLFRALRTPPRLGGSAGAPSMRIARFLPGFLLGFIAFAALRNAGDDLWGTGTAGWRLAVEINERVVELLIVVVSASIGLHLELKRFVTIGMRAVAVGAAASVWTAGMGLALITLSVRGYQATAIAVGSGGLALTAMAWFALAKRLVRPASGESLSELTGDSIASTSATPRAPFALHYVLLAGVFLAAISVYAETAWSRWRRREHANHRAVATEALSDRAATLRHTVCDPRCPPGMQYIAGGSFSMGASDRHNPDELPIHTRTMAPFCYDATEVTVSEYLACARERSCTPVDNTTAWPDLSEHDAEQWDRFCNANRPGTADHPINCVDWYQSEFYCRAHGFRLPTEDEWEYVARGGDEQRRYSWGNQRPSAELSNLCGEECSAVVVANVRVWAPLFAGMRDAWPTTAPIASFPAGIGRWGIHDQTGNVTEWLQSSYCPYPDTTCIGGDRVARGNGYLANLLMKVRAARRNHDRPWHRSPDAGFRCARSLPLPSGDRP